MNRYKWHYRIMVGFWLILLVSNAWMVYIDIRYERFAMLVGNVVLVGLCAFWIARNMRYLDLIEFVEKIESKLDGQD